MDDSRCNDRMKLLSAKLMKALLSQTVWATLHVEIITAW